MSLLKSPACYICILFFIIHQILQKILYISFPLLDCYFDPLLCIPILMSFLLIERRWLLKQPDFYFSKFETVVITIVLAVIFEEIFPRISGEFTRDVWDYLFYFLGGIYFYFIIQEKPSKKPSTSVGCLPFDEREGYKR